MIDRKKIEESFWLRVGILVVPIAIAVVCLLVWSFSPSDREGILLVTMFVIGASLPALLIGAALGWLKYSRRVWLWSTAILLIPTAIFLINVLR